MSVVVSDPVVPIPSFKIEMPIIPTFQSNNSKESKLNLIIPDILGQKSSVQLQKFDCNKMKEGIKNMDEITKELEQREANIKILKP